MISAPDRETAVLLIDEAIASGCNKRSHNQKTRKKVLGIY